MGGLKLENLSVIGLAGEAVAVGWGMTEGGGFNVGEGTTIGEGAVVGEGTTVGLGTDVGEGAWLEQPDARSMRIMTNAKQVK